MTIRRNVVLLCALLSACASNSAIEDSRAFLDQGYVLQAFQSIETEYLAQLRDGGEVDAEVKEAYDSLHFRLLLEQARQAIYANDELRGIELLNDALQLRPGEEVSLSLVARAHRKLAIRATSEGQDLLAKADLEGAMTAFAKALEYLPDHEPAKKGLGAVRESVSRLHAEAQAQFLEAIRKLPQFRFPEADWHATAALTRDKSRDDAAEVQKRAQRELADEARLRADANRVDKKYGAALMDYRTARRLWPELPGIDGFVQQMEREVEVVAKTERAQLAIKAGRLSEAKSLLDEAFEQSTLERGAINELRFQIRRQAGQIAYDAARDLELQGLKVEALAAYTALAADWPDGMLDEQTRIGALQNDIAGAEREFAAGEAAEQAKDPAAALDHYRMAKTYYEKFKDVVARVTRLASAVAPAGRSGS